MADDDKNKDGKGGEGGKPAGDDAGRPMSTSEIAAAAAAAKKLLDDEKGGGGDGKGGDDKSVLDDDPNKDGDRTKLDIDKTLKYVDKLKDENAQRRIENRKLTDRLTKTEQQLQSAAKALEDATARMKEVDTKTEAEKAKERSDLENAAKKIDELTTSIADMKKDLDSSKQVAADANRQVQRVNRETMIERLVEQQGARFASDFERDGLIANLTKRSSDGDFEKNNDEVIYEVMKFIETAPKGDGGGGGEGDLNVPGAGPGGRKTQTPVGDEIQSLLAKKARLSAEEKSRLGELLKMASDARQSLAPQRRR